MRSRLRDFVEVKPTRSIPFIPCLIAFPGVEDGDDHSDDPFICDDMVDDDDFFAEYKANGERRALSESRRDWKFVCEFEGCGQRFNRPCRLESHMRMHTKERPFPCPEDGCGKTFTRKDHLNRHVKNTHMNIEPEKKYTCDWDGCGKRFRTPSHLRNHKALHESKFYCIGYPPCKEVFRKQKTLDQHIASKHLNVDPWPCTCVINEETGEKCTKSYQTEAALRRHQLSAHNPEAAEQRLFFCPMCPTSGTELEALETENGIVMFAKEPLTFQTHPDLVTHNKEVHPPMCLTCGLKVRDKQALRSHIDSQHGDPNDKAQFFCPDPDCDRTFSRENNLKVHIRCVHEQHKPFVCAPSFTNDTNKLEIQSWDGHNACGVAFGAKASLEQHIRTQHLRTKNRKETRKEKKSKKKPEPSMVRLLTGEGFDGGREIPCLVESCGDRFFRNYDLKRHLVAVHEWNDDELNDSIIERDALSGGQFWIGGRDQPVFESAESSIPQTPDPLMLPPNPYQNGFKSPFLSTDLEDMKPIDPRLSGEHIPFESLKLSLVDEEEASMDEEMGLSELQTWNALHGLPPS